MRRWLALLAWSALLFACDDGGGGGGGDDDDVIAPDAAPGDGDGGPGGPDGGGGGDPDASPPAWTTLITGDWSLPAGTEGYTCVYLTVAEDLWFDGIEAIAPLGTHHTVLSFADSPQRADGTVSCSALTQFQNMLYASGVGTDTFTFPAGVGMRVRAGQQILLNLHLFNFGDSPLPGTSGIRVRTLPAPAASEAEGLLAGSILFSIAPGPDRVVNGTCTMTGSTNIFALIPHMHMLGTHFKVVAESTAMGDVTIHDAPYTFDDQRVNNVTPVVPMVSGDRLRVTCTYNNTTGGTVFFGESSLQEMCFSITYRYPALAGGSLICAN
jgi:hypothetical protein